MPQLNEFLNISAYLLGFLLFVLYFIFDEPLHFKRNISKRERLSHFIDSTFSTITLAVGLASKLTQKPFLFYLYFVLAVLTILVSFKDEGLHKRESTAKENMIHAAMFSVNAALFFALGLLIITNGDNLIFYASIIIAFFTATWNVYFMTSTNKQVNNDFYSELTLHDWWEADDHMVTLLRHESKIKLDYLIENVGEVKGKKILDLGSGAGLISIPLAKMGAEVTSIDLSGSALKLLREKADKEKVSDNIKSIQADLMKELSLNEKFDLVLAFDVLEHVPYPERIIEAASRHLKENGKFFYHTLNQTPQCTFLYLWLLPKLIDRDPGEVHTQEFNIPHKKVLTWLQNNELKASPQIGIKAGFFQKAIWELLSKGRVQTPLEFSYTKDLSFGYLGSAEINTQPNSLKERLPISSTATN